MPKLEFEKNVGRADQIIRIAMGLGLLSMIALAPESGYWGLIGLLPLVSAVVRYCPTYQLIGVRTSKRDL